MERLTKQENILKALRETGRFGIHSFHMRRIGGLQAPVRIKELREKGYKITSIQERMGNAMGCRYFLTEQPINNDPYFDKLRKRFFAVSNQLGYESEIVKERAKKYFGVGHFNDLKPEQLKVIINKLEAQAQLRLI